MPEERKTTFAELSERLASDAPPLAEYPRRTDQVDPDTMSFEAEPTSEEIPLYKDVAAGLQLRLGRRYGARSRPDTPEARRAQATEDAHNALRAGKANWYDVQFFSEGLGTALDTLDPDAAGVRGQRFQELREEQAHSGVAGGLPNQGLPGAPMTRAPTPGSDVANYLRAQFMESVDVPGREATALSNAEPPRVSRGWAGFEDRTAARVREQFGEESEQRYREGEEAYGKLGFPLMAMAAVSPGPIDFGDAAALAKRGLKFVPGLGVVSLHHGSPNKFAQPAIGVGKGEGGRSGYGMAGYGVYAADRPGVAKNYMLAGADRRVKIDGHSLDEIAEWLPENQNQVLQRRHDAAYEKYAAEHPANPPPTPDLSVGYHAKRREWEKGAREDLASQGRWFNAYHAQKEFDEDWVVDRMVVDRMRNYGNISIDEARKSLIDDARRLGGDFAKARAQAAVDRIDELKKSGRLTESKGHKYEWEWDIADDEALMWDRPLSEQSPRVQRALKGVLGEEPPPPRDIGQWETGNHLQTDAGWSNGRWSIVETGNAEVRSWDLYQADGHGNLDWIAESRRDPRTVDPDDTAVDNLVGLSRKMGEFRESDTGKDIYRKITSELGDERLASEALREAGIPGHRFEDYTRGTGGKKSIQSPMGLAQRMVEDADGDFARALDEVNGRMERVPEFRPQGEKIKKILESGKVDPAVQTYNAVIYDTSKITALKRDGKPIPYEEFVREVGTPEDVTRQAADQVQYVRERGRGDRAKNEAMRAAAESNALTEQYGRELEPAIREGVMPVMNAARGVDDAARLGRGPFGSALTGVDDGPVEALVIPKLARGGRKGKQRIMVNPNPVKAEVDKSLIPANKDARGELRRSLNSDPLDGLPNLVEQGRMQGGPQRIVAHGAGGREMVLGDVGPDDIERHIKSMTSKERFDSRPFYDQLRPLFRQAFGENAERNLMIWAMSNKNESPSGAMGITLRSTEQWDAIDRSLRDTSQFGLSTENIQKFLTASGLSDEEALSIAAKLHDFFDATHGVRLRSWMNFDKRGLRPSPIDIHAQRSNGYLTEKFRNRLLGKGGRPGVVTDPAERALIEAAPLDKGAPKGPSYEHPLRNYNEVAQRFNDQKYMGFDDWEAKHVQAIDWAYIQRAQGMEPEDPLHMFMKRMSSMPVELDPGAGADVAYRVAWEALDDAKKRGVTTEMVEAVVRDLSEVLGIQTIPDMSPGSGVYMDWANPNSVADFISTGDAAEDLSRAVAYALSQTEGLVVNADVTKPLLQSATKWAPDETIHFDITGTGLEDDAKRIEFFQELRERGFAATDIWPAPDGMMKTNVRGEDGIRVLFDNSPDKALAGERKRWLGAIADLQQDFVDGQSGVNFGVIQDAANEVGLEGQIFVDWGRAHVRRQKNDWTQAATRAGGDHLSPLERSRGEVFVGGLQRYRSSFVAPYAEAQIEAARTGVAAPPRERFPLPHELSFSQRTGEPRARLQEQRVGGTFGGQYPRIRRPVQFNMSRDFPPVRGSGGPGAGMDTDRRLQEQLRSHSPARKPR